jgi:hypothetical protein
MIVKLRYGYRDLEDVIEEDKECKRGLRLTTEIVEEETGEVFVLVDSQWKFEIKKYVHRWLPQFPEMADSIIDENIVQP